MSLKGLHQEFVWVQSPYLRILYQRYSIVVFIAVLFTFFETQWGTSSSIPLVPLSPNSDHSSVQCWPGLVYLGSRYGHSCVQYWPGLVIQGLHMTTALCNTVLARSTLCLHMATLQYSPGLPRVWWHSTSQREIRNSKTMPGILEEL